MKVGFLGLGNMGSAMAKQLITAGFDVLVWNRSPEKAEPLVALGAEAVSDPYDALAQDVSISMFANDRVAENILNQERVEKLDGKLHLNMASVSPACGASLTKRFSDAGARYVASPVLGRPQVAAAGQLNILAAGDPHDIKAAKPFYDAMGKKTWIISDSQPVANLVKIAVNYNIIHAIQALAESIALTEAAGVEATRFVDILSNTLFGGVVYTGYGQLIAQKMYLPQAFSLELGLKDLNLARSEASHYGVSLPTADLLGEILQQAIENPELNQLDWSAMAEVTRR
jgi:3-hydroxyisobutyrate dehydrogenase-like beta-hydroxyacid dehydrogenase